MHIITGWLTRNREPNRKAERLYLCRAGHYWWSVYSNNERLARFRTIREAELALEYTHWIGYLSGCDVCDRRVEKVS